MPRDATGKAKETKPRAGVTLGAVLDAMGIGSRSAAEAAGRREGAGSDGLAGGAGDDALTGGAVSRGEERQVAPAPPAPEPFDVAGRYAEVEAGIPQFIVDQATPADMRQIVDLGAQRINRDVAERVAGLGYLPGGLGTWLLDAVHHGDGETALRAAGLVHEIRDKAKDHPHILTAGEIQVADAIRERQEADLGADPDAIASGARRRVDARNAIAWIGRGFRETPVDLAEFGEDVMSGLDTAAADYVDSRWSALSTTTEDLSDDAMKATVHVTLGLVALHPNKPWTGMLQRAKELDDLRKDWLAIDPDRPRSALADPAKEFLKDAAKDVADKIEKRTGSRHLRAAKRAGTGALAVADTLESMGELYERATADGLAHREAAGIARAGTAMRMGSEIAAGTAIIADRGSIGGGALQDRHFEAMEDATAYGLYQALSAISSAESQPLLDQAYEYVSEEEETPRQ